VTKPPTWQQKIARLQMAYEPFNPDEADRILDTVIQHLDGYSSDSPCFTTGQVARLLIGLPAPPRKGRKS
jgi:hypothetical protein